MHAYLRSGVLFALLALPVTKCLAEGTEEFGNEPLSEANYTAWPRIVAVVNDKSRVYQNWVNGNENFYYAGGSDELNRVLKSFAAAEMPVHEVVLRPDPGVTRSFDQTRGPIKFNWHLHIVAGIAGSLTGSDKGDLVWPKHPRLTIHTGPDFDFARLDVPKGVSLVSVEEQSARARLAMDSTAQNVRGWSAGVVAQLDNHDPANLAALERLLADDDDWVRLNAAGSIGLFGREAKSAIPALKNCLERKDANLRTAATKAIETIEAAPDRTEEAQAHLAGLKKIKMFIEANRPKP